jgi:hypothetical protein
MPCRISQQAINLTIMRILLPIKNSFLLLPAADDYIADDDIYISSHLNSSPSFYKSKRVMACSSHTEAINISALPLLTSEKTTAHCSLI